jgi:hypothetical protein
MADVVGRGVIEVSADASKLKAGIDDAKRSIKSFGKDVSGSVGTASARASNSIDRYVRSLQTQAGSPPSLRGATRRGEQRTAHE